MNRKVLIVTDCFNNAERLYDNSSITQLENLIKRWDIKSESINVSENLHKFLEKESNLLVFNLVPLMGSKYSWFLPALCDYLRIPYTGSGIFTISALIGNYYKDILNYHGMKEIKSSKQLIYNISLVGNGDKLIFNVKQLNKNKIVFNRRNIDKKLLNKFLKMIKILKASLRIYDYFSINLTPNSSLEGEININQIQLSPCLTKNSQFYLSLKTLGLSYGEIIISILISTMIRNNLPLFDEFIPLYEKLTELID